MYKSSGKRANSPLITETCTWKSIQGGRIVFKPDLYTNSNTPPGRTGLRTSQTCTPILTYLRENRFADEPDLSTDYNTPPGRTGLRTSQTCTPILTHPWESRIVFKPDLYIDSNTPRENRTTYKRDMYIESNTPPREQDCAQARLVHRYAPQGK